MRVFQFLGLSILLEFSHAAVYPYNLISYVELLKRNFGIYILHHLGLQTDYLPKELTNVEKSELLTSFPVTAPSDPRCLNPHNLLPQEKLFAALEMAIYLAKIYNIGLHYKDPFNRICIFKKEGKIDITLRSIPLHYLTVQREGRVQLRAYQMIPTIANPFEEILYVFQPYLKHFMIPGDLIHTRDVRHFLASPSSTLPFLSQIDKKRLTTPLHPASIALDILLLLKSPEFGSHSLPLKEQEVFLLRHSSSTKSLPPLINFPPISCLISTPLPIAPSKAKPCIIPPKGLNSAKYGKKAFIKGKSHLPLPHQSIHGRFKTLSKDTFQHPSSPLLSSFAPSTPVLSKKRDEKFFFRSELRSLCRSLTNPRLTEFISILCTRQVHPDTHQYWAYHFTRHPFLRQFQSPLKFFTSRTSISLFSTPSLSSRLHPRSLLPSFSFFTKLRIVTLYHASQTYWTLTQSTKKDLKSLAVFGKMLLLLLHFFAHLDKAVYYRENVYEKAELMMNLQDLYFVLRNKNLYSSPGWFYSPFLLENLTAAFLKAEVSMMDDVEWKKTAFVCGEECQREKREYMRYVEGLYTAVVKKCYSGESGEQEEGMLDEEEGSQIAEILPKISIECSEPTTVLKQKEAMQFHLWLYQQLSFI